MTQAMLSTLRHFPTELTWTPTFDKALEKLLEGEQDVALVDYFLGDRTGLDLLAEVRDRAIRIPMIMLTGKGSRSVDVEAMETGAADYLEKGKIEPATLERAIRYAVEHSRVDEALRASEERLRGMFDHLPLGLYRCAPNGDFVDANPALVRMLGYPSPRLLRERYARSFYVAAENLDDFLWTLESDGELRGFETTILDAAGRPLRLRHTARAHRSPTGDLEYIEGAVEPAWGGNAGAERSASRYRTLVGTLGLPLMRLDPGGRILDISPAFASRVGARPGDLITRSIEEVVGTDAAAAAAEAADDPAVASPPVSWRFGDDHEIRVRLAAVPDGIGEAEEILVVLAD
jgi:PAS domain S-box-containing protein